MAQTSTLTSIGVLTCVLDFASVVLYMFQISIVGIKENLCIKEGLEGLSVPASVLACRALRAHTALPVSFGDIRHV